MLKELTNVIKTIKPKNILQTIKSPSHGLWAFKYHYRRDSDRDFVEFISKQWGCTTEETFEKRSTLFKFKEDENFNQRNTLSISGLKFEPDKEIGQKGTFCKGLTFSALQIYVVSVLNG